MKFAVLLFFTGLLVFYGSCKTDSSGREEPPPVPGGGTSPIPRPSGGGVADEIRSLVETGSPGSLNRALEEIRSRGLGNSEFGRVMNAAAGALVRHLYPDLQISLPPSDPPQVNAYTRIFRDIERGVYTPPQGGSDYLELVLPFLALLKEGAGGTVPPESLPEVLPDLRRARDLNPGSVLAPYFLGLVYEWTGQFREASAEFTRAAELAPDCYPAALGLARIREALGQRQEAAQLLSDLIVRYPDNMGIKRQLARSYYNNRDWSRAEPAVAELLQRHNRDGELLLMRAHIFVEQGQFIQAQAPLDLYASIDPNNRLYLFLRARVQAEGYRNRDAALNYLRSILRNNPNDDEVAVYTARQLMDSNRAADQNEGRALMRRLLDTGTPSPAVISLVLQDAVRR